MPSVSMVTSCLVLINQWSKIEFIIRGKEGQRQMVHVSHCSQTERSWDYLSGCISSAIL